MYKKGLGRLSPLKDHFRKLTSLTNKMADRSMIDSRTMDLPSTPLHAPGKRGAGTLLTTHPHTFIRIVTNFNSP